MLKKLAGLFLGMVMTTTVAETYLIAGTWQYLLLQSITLAFILFFIYHFIGFQLQEKRQNVTKAHPSVKVDETREDEKAMQRLIQK
ncbi:hypothetical protein [Staphylococcus lutrae]|uniref:Uncharacterized protein n=1 Tax=Staphylococcus lutrae TaxID=155085 RepID=A0AAC9WIR6_9STAP|nr:hypothetical protein [Staphylococcus lutrae]ARJ50564.1 hypothetical protein B5P37_04160 [Staphylococcus lutrae]PNZ37493.1 hypothetical protein CD134_06065 [Staphylococcus lutrae]